MINYDGEAITPPVEGVKLAIITTSVVFILIAIVVVFLRVWVRWTEKSFWWDDATMFAALLVYNITIGLSCRSVWLGLGTHKDRLTEDQERQARKFFAIWLPLYAACLVLIKASICITMLRLTQTMRYTRWAIYVLQFLSISAFIISVTGSATSCKPFQANWNQRLLADGEATCAPVSGVLGITYTTTTITVITDIACAIIPGIILWNTQLKLKVKVSVGVLLSFGLFASVCTMVRAPYIKYYADDDLIFWLANLVLWSNIENAVGLIAGSVPILQRLIMRRFFKRDDSTNTPNSVGLVTFGSAPMKSRNRRVFSNPTDIGYTVATVQTVHNPHWERLEEDMNFRDIRTDFTYEVHTSQASEADLIRKEEIKE